MTNMMFLVNYAFPAKAAFNITIMYALMSNFSDLSKHLYIYIYIFSISAYVYVDIDLKKYF